MTAARRTLIIFVKEPRVGRVKTRLGREIGHVAAAWWFRHQTAGLIRRLARDRRWETVLAVAPDGAVGSRAWPAHPPRMAQGTGDLGARMRRALSGTGPGPSVLVGGDIPRITARHVWEAFRCLQGHDAVVGPATDGGYWLIGLTNGAMRLPETFLTDVRWSSCHALSDTLKSAGGLRVAMTATLDDVDTAADLRRSCGRR